MCTLPAFSDPFTVGKPSPCAILLPSIISTISNIRMTPKYCSLVLTLFLASVLYSKSLCIHSPGYPFSNSKLMSQNKQPSSHCSLILILFLLSLLLLMLSSSSQLSRLISYFQESQNTFRKT